MDTSLFHQRTAIKSVILSSCIAHLAPPLPLSCSFLTQQIGGSVFREICWGGGGSRMQLLNYSKNMLFFFSIKVLVHIFPVKSRLAP